MRKRLLLFSALLAVSVLTFPGRASDVIHLQTGESAVCEIEAVTDTIIVFHLRGPGGGSAKRTLPMERVDFIEFGFEEGEEAVFNDLGNIPADILETWWEFHFGHLHRPRSRTAAYGIAFGNALLRESPESGAARAISVFDRVIARAWDAGDQALAKQGRLRALIASGDLETAVGEAQVLAAETEDPDLLIEVNFLLAEADFARLEAIEEEHPKWIEDDEVRPERNALYHRVLDQYLWAHLFHATREEDAARGLLHAGKVYEFAGELELARAAYADLGKLYPDTEANTTAVARLADLSQPE